MFLIIEIVTAYNRTPLHEDLFMFHSMGPIKRSKLKPLESVKKAEFSSIFVRFLYLNAL